MYICMYIYIIYIYIYIHEVSACLAHDSYQSNHHVHRWRLIACDIPMIILDILTVRLGGFELVCIMLHILLLYVHLHKDTTGLSSALYGKYCILCLLFFQRFINESINQIILIL